MKGYLVRMVVAIAAGLVGADLILQANNQSLWFVRAALAGVAALNEPIVWVENAPRRAQAVAWTGRTLARHAGLLLVFDLTLIGFASVPVDQVMYIGGMQVALLLTLATGMAKVMVAGIDDLRWRLYRTLMIASVWAVVGAFIGLAYNFDAPDHVQFFFGGLFSLGYGVYNIFEVNRSRIQYMSGR